MIAAIIPIKRNSVRIPGKNFLPINGIPLYCYVVNALEKVKAVTSILVDTDCPELLGELEHVKKLRTIRRPLQLRGDAVVMNELLEPILEHAQGEYFLQTHVTNPLLRPETIEKCIDLFFSQLDRFDSLFTVNKIQKRMYDAEGNPINHDLAVMEMTQDLKPVFVENSNLFLFSRTSYFANGKNRIGKKPAMYVMNELEGLDIDGPAELELARALLSSPDGLKDFP